MHRRVVSGVCGLLVCVLAVGCGRREPDEPPVATPSLSLNKTRAALGSPLEVTYRFEVADGARFDTDYTVFLHVLDPDHEQLWTDDHLPPVPTSEWEPGQTVEYTRTIFVPSYPYIGEAALRLGLYSQATGRRLPLAGREVGRREYEVGRLQLAPASENVFVIFREGWHPAEIAADNPSVEWQWTKKTAVLSFRNPRRDILFYLEADARADLMSPPQQVTIRAGNDQVAQFTADNTDRQLRTIPLSAAELGDGEMTELSLEVDRLFAPGGNDPRELGIRVYNAFIEPR